MGNLVEIMAIWQSCQSKIVRNCTDCPLPTTMIRESKPVDICGFLNDMDGDYVLAKALRKRRLRAPGVRYCALHCAQWPKEG